MEKKKIKLLDWIFVIGFIFLAFLAHDRITSLDISQSTIDAISSIFWLVTAMAAYFVMDKFVLVPALYRA